MKEELIQIAKNCLLEEGSTVILQCWVEEENQWFENLFKEVLIDRGYKVVSATLNSTNIHKLIEQKELEAEQLYGKDWMNSRNIIDVCQFSPPSLMGQIEDNAKESFVGFMRTIFGCFTEDNKTFLQIRIPSQEAAVESGLDLDTYKDLWSSLIHVDYKELNEEAAKRIKELSKIDEFELITTDSKGISHSLNLELNDRKWYKDTGNGDFPAGEVYIAPIESLCHGSYVASKVNWEGNSYEEVVLTFSKGKLVSSSEEVIMNDLQQAPGDSLMIGEFGIGLNKGLKQQCGYGLFDEKIKGTCHIAIGANHMFGGNNQSPVHVDFVASRYDIERRI